MITITFPDGNQRSYESGTTAMDVAKSISHGLARNILSGSFDGNTIDAHGHGHATHTRGDRCEAPYTAPGTHGMRPCSLKANVERP